MLIDVHMRLEVAEANPGVPEFSVDGDRTRVAREILAALAREIVKVHGMTRDDGDAAG